MEIIEGKHLLPEYLHCYCAVANKKNKTLPPLNDAATRAFSVACFLIFVSFTVEKHLTNKTLGLEVKKSSVVIFRGNRDKFKSLVIMLVII